MWPPRRDHPFRWLPLSAIPLALNLFAALCAFLTLTLLARSVVLLPHDRTDGQRENEPDRFGILSIRSAWLPPVLAVMVCGLQMTFWENATAFSGEMLNVLVFAYVIRCLLEYRVDEGRPWLYRAAFAYSGLLYPLDHPPSLRSGYRSQHGVHGASPVDQIEAAGGRLGPVARRGW